MANRRLASMIASGPMTARRSWSTGGRDFMAAATNERFASQPFRSTGSTRRKKLARPHTLGFHRISARNGDAVPDIHHDGQPFDRGDLLLIERRGGFFINGVRNLPLGDAGYGFGEQKGGTFLVGEISRLAPGGEHADAVARFAC